MPAIAKIYLLHVTYDFSESWNNKTLNYYEMFDTDDFFEWMETLLDTLLDMLIHNTVILIDNVK